MGCSCTHFCPHGTKVGNLTVVCSSFINLSLWVFQINELCLVCRFFYHCVFHLWPTDRCSSASSSVHIHKLHGPDNAVCHDTSWSKCVQTQLKSRTPPPEIQTTHTPHTGSVCAMTFIYHRYQPVCINTTHLSRKACILYRIKNVPWVNERLTIYFFYVLKGEPSSDMYRNCCNDMK